MRRVGDEGALGGEQFVEPVGHRGDRVGQRSQLGRAAGRSGRDGEVAVGEAVGVGLQSSHRARDGAGQPPSDEGDEADDHDADGGEAEPEAVDAGGDVARVDREAQRAVHRSAGRDRHRDVEDVGCQGVGGSGSRRAFGRSAPRRSRAGWRSRDRSGPAVSIIEMPSRSTTTTLAPVRSLYSVAAAGSSGRSFSRSSS